MVKAIIQGELFSFLSKCQKANAPNESECAYIIEKLKLKNIIQILFDFGLPTLKCILRYYEEKQDYEYCALIIDSLKRYNKLTGKDYKIQ